MTTNLSRVATQWGFTEFVQAASQNGLLYTIPVAHSPSNATIVLDQREFVNFAGINFLGFQQEEEIIAHFAQAAATYGLVTGGSRITQGISIAHRNVEQELCRLTGKERAISFASGLLANLGFVHAMSADFYMNSHCNIDNRDTVFVLDHDCHWSLWKAVERFSFGKQLFSFHHNDPCHLHEVLSALAGKKVVVIFESVYSSDGSIAPMGKLLDICEEQQAISYVDDANGFLLYGPSSRPFAAEFAHLRRATFVMVSFSKSVGLEGGAIAGPADAIFAFELLSGTATFTAAMQPPTASTAFLLMQKIVQYPEIVDEYLARVANFRHRLADLGCTLNPMPSYITSILIGSDEKVKHVRDAFRSHGYIVPVFYYPAVKIGQAILRIILNYRHTQEQIDTFIELLAEFKRRYAF